MAFYKVEIAVASHKALQRGITEEYVSYVNLEAVTEREAVLVACQMAICCYPHEVMPTRALLLTFPEIE